MLIVAQVANKWRHAADACDNDHRLMGMLDR